jgi:hypothetical protein
VRTASILLALIVVLGFVNEAGAWERIVSENRYTISIAGHETGFMDQHTYDTEGRYYWSAICLGPFGSHQVPFTAAQGLIGFCLILATLIIVPAVLTVRWRRRAIL